MSSFKDYLKKTFYLILTRSLKEAAREQGLDDLIARLEKIVPDISDQYSTFKLDSNYLKRKARNMHAFQISLINKVISEFNNPVIVDIGDSAGTHSQYILGFHSQNKSIKCLSVNLDSKAVEKIKAKGLDAVKVRAEDLHERNINADVFICFEMLEHLMDPCNFLRRLSSKSNAKYLIFTVPYLKNGRVGLHHIRQHKNDDVFAENTHIFELSPEDWRLIVRHAGWDVIEEKIYLQYPQNGFAWITKPFWKKFDFEGFYGAILKRDDTYSLKYKDWQ